MDYEERLPPEHINTSDEHPLKELVVLLSGSVLFLAVIVFVLHQSSGWLARHVPVSTEQRVFASDVDAPVQQTGLDHYLYARLAALMQQFSVPEGMRVSISVVPSGVKNAFAAPGSRIILMRGLLERLESENALSMLLAHELAHLVHRDPLVSMARGASVNLVLALISGESDRGVLNMAAEMALLGFSRDMEDAADYAALRALGGVYGHTAGAAQLFRALMDDAEMTSADRVPTFLSTHPALKDRIRLLAERSREVGYPVEGDLTPLPSRFQRWLDDLGEDSQPGEPLQEAVGSMINGAA